MKVFVYHIVEVHQNLTPLSVWSWGWSNDRTSLPTLRIRWQFVLAAHIALLLLGIMLLLLSKYVHQFMLPCPDIGNMPEHIAVVPKIDTLCL